MSDGTPIMYHSNGGFSTHGPVYMMPGQMERQTTRHYPLEVLQVIGNVGCRGSAMPALTQGQGTPSSGQSTPRRTQNRRYRSSKTNTQNTAFGYDSDDSSLSSNASGSNKSGDKGQTSQNGDGNVTNNNSSNGYVYHGQREWRGRQRRDQHNKQRRIAPERYLNATYPFQIKYTPDDLLNGSKWDFLSQEIWDKFVKSQQTEDTFRKKMTLWRHLYITIKTLFPRYGLYVVGSTMSGFGLDSSDVDLCLFVRPGDAIEPRAHALLHLNFVLGFIKGFDPGAELIHAKVPILKFRDPRTGLQVDLNCNNVVGIRNTNLLHCYSRMDWRVRPLVAITKLWAQAHNINDARQRTLSSYSLTLMVIHYLQCGASPPVLPCVCEGAWEPRHRLANRQPLGELFTNMLSYYADFPYGKFAVSVRAGCAVPVAECRAAKSHKNDPHQWKLLCVEEPFDLTNTARSVYDPETFEVIVNTFKESHRRLSIGLRLADAWPSTER